MDFQTIEHAGSLLSFDPMQNYLMQNTKGFLQTSKDLKKEINFPLYYPRKLLLPK